MATAIQQNPAPQGVQLVPLAEIHTSKTNPRKHFPKEELEDLAASIKAYGVLQPILLRPHGKGHEIVAGERRFRASHMAALETIPALVRTLSDTEVLEIQVVENLQRRDLHPLEEADGYRQLMGKPGYDVARIAERVGRSVKYIYDRVKLLSLTKAAQQEFLEGRISAGHAILLARLAPKDQERAMDLDTGGLWQDQRTLFNPSAPEDDDSEKDEYKPVSVRELQGWIDEHVKLEAAQLDPMLFPETVATVVEAAEEAEKVVRITHEEITPAEARDDGQKIVLGRSWKRADGTLDSKTCDRSVTGIIVIGPGRGEAFKVCTDKKGCAVHWGAEQKAAKKREATASAGGKTGEDRYAIQERRQKEEQAREQAEEARWKKAVPAILTAVAAAVKKAPAGAKSVLADIVMGQCQPRQYGVPNDAGKYLTRGTSAEDLVRHAAFAAIAGSARRWDARSHFPKTAKAFGVDVRKIVDQVAPKEKAKGVPEARCRNCGCTEAKACDVGGRGCSWVEKPDPKTGKGLCSAPACVGKAKKAKLKKKAAARR